MQGNPTFYYRNGCHLCEEMASVLYRGWPDRVEHMAWRDVEESESWRQAYGLRVPVLMLDNVEVCHFTADLERIRKYFGPEQNPV